MLGIPVNREVFSKTSAQPKAAPRITIPKDLPVEETTIDIDEAAKIAADGTLLKFIGCDVSDKLAIEPCRMFIRRTLRKKYAHPTLEELGVISAPLHQIIDGGMADESLIVDVLVKKYDDFAAESDQRNLSARWQSELGKTDAVRLGFGQFELACAARRGD